jgi:DNA polymerase III delta prime subunit
MQVYRQVWPLLVKVWPAGVRRALPRKVVLVSAAAENSAQKSAWLESARDLLDSTCKVASWWSYNPDREYVDRLRESLPSWLYISYGGEIARRGHIVDFAGPEDEPIESPWPEHTLPEERGKTDFKISTTGKGHQARMWFLLDHLETVSPPLEIDDFEAIGEKYQNPGPNNFAFAYEPVNSPPPPPPPPSSPVASLSSYLAARGFHFPHHLIATYYLSLQTKPFVILSGLSGTGKTKLAQLFAHWLAGEEHAALIPVHPDWTDNRGLLGFHHLLTGAYHTTDFLHLLLRAYADYANGERHPYFAILDEMNLARVEHYFADFLSAMESRRLDEDGRIRQDPFSLHHQPRCLLATGNQALAEGFYTGDRDHKTCVVSCAGCPFRALVSEQHRCGAYAYEEARRDGFDPLHFVPPRLEVPLNAYITGTVNVDETTFTFSPKVLDRANVIELGEVDLEACWERTEHFGDLSWVFRTDDRIARGFTGDFAYPFATGLRREARQAPELAPYRERLVTLLELLEPYHLHFGYRVADEILTYLLNAHRLDDERFDLEAAFDHAILQKILPRLNGPRERFQEPLARLRMFCAQGREGVADLLQEDRHYRRWEHLQDAEARLQRSTRKLQRMQRDLETEGFTSFT